MKHQNPLFFLLQSKHLAAGTDVLVGANLTMWSFNSNQSVVGATQITSSA